MGCNGVDVASVVAPVCGAHVGVVPEGTCDCWQACGSRDGAVLRRRAAKSVRDADPAWQLSCLEYGLVGHADGRLACVDGSVLFDAPSMLLDQGEGYTDALARILFGHAGSRGGAPDRACVKVVRPAKQCACV